MGRSPSRIKNAITMADLLRTNGLSHACGRKAPLEAEPLTIAALIAFMVFITVRARVAPITSIPVSSGQAKVSPARKRGESRAYCFDDQKMIPYYTPEEKDWYTTDYFTKWAIDFLEEYKNEDKPYFLYISYTAPHDPLHAWPKDIAKYDGVYDVGYEAIRKSPDSSRQQEMGLFGSWL